MEKQKEIENLFKEREYLYFDIRDKLSHLKSIEENIIYLFPFKVCHVDIIKWFLKNNINIEDFEEHYKSIRVLTDDPVEIITNLNKLLAI